jgi:hypothetical protein
LEVHWLAANAGGENSRGGPTKRAAAASIMQSASMAVNLPGSRGMRNRCGFDRRRKGRGLTEEALWPQCSLVDQADESKLRAVPRLDMEKPMEMRSSPAARMERFAALQKRALALLASSPEGSRRFWERNLKKRRRIHGPE